MNSGLPGFTNQLCLVPQSHQGKEHDQLMCLLERRGTTTKHPEKGDIATSCIES